MAGQESCSKDGWVGRPKISIFEGLTVGGKAYIITLVLTINYYLLFRPKSVNENDIEQSHS